MEKQEAILYHRLLQDLCAKEKKEPYLQDLPIIKEKTVRCLWVAQKFKHKRFRTLNGHKIEILSPGGWNSHQGPDFLGAKIAYSQNKVVEGDIEIHVRSSDWEKHGHSRNSRYGNVILHVFLIKDTKGKFAKGWKGKRIPQIELRLLIAMSRAELDDLAHCDQYPFIAKSWEGECKKKFGRTKKTRQVIISLLKVAGKERMMAKRDRFVEAFQHQNTDQVLYESILGALGYEVNTQAMRSFANHLSFSKIWSIAGEVEEKQRPLIFSAVLLGVGGFLSELPQNKQLNRRGREALKLWQSFKHDFEPLPQEKWICKGTRPNNFPQLRILGASYLLQNIWPMSLSRKVFEIFGNPPYEKDVRAITREILDFLGIEGELLWEDSKSSPVKLIGEDRARVIIVNVIIPYLLALTRNEGSGNLEKKLLELYDSLGLLPDTQVSRFITLRLFGKEKIKEISNACIQQGLYQIFGDFCSFTNKDCKGCQLLGLIKRMSKEIN